MLVTVVSAGTLGTENKISNRLKSSFLNAHVKENAKSGVLGERLIFWKAHQEMIKDKPFFGHGPGLTAEYRSKYYEKAGFENYDRPSTAHNQYLQVAVNAGLIGLFFFVAFFIFLFSAIATEIKSKNLRCVLYQIIGLFLIGGITQNAFQDYEVRHTLMVVLTWMISNTTMEADKSDEIEAALAS